MKAAPRNDTPLAIDGDDVEVRPQVHPYEIKGGMPDRFNHAVGHIQAQGGTMSPGARHRIEFGVPEDEQRLLLRVWLDGDWSGDLLFASADARGAFLDALTAGEFSAVRRPIQLADACTELEIALPTALAAAEVQPAGN